MERDEKPEFCYESRIEKSKDDLGEYIRTSDKEIVKRSTKAFELTNKAKWKDEILPEASLSLKMNYRFLE